MKRSGLLRFHGCIGWVFALLASAAAAQAPLAMPDLPLGLAGTVNAIARQPDGGLILGGSFAMIDGVPRRNLARLQADGTLDLEWNPPANDTVLVLAADSNGDVYAGGYFSEIGGQARALVAKISGSGSGAVDANWNPGVRIDDDSGFYLVNQLAVDGNRAVYLAGEFSSVGGLPRHRLAKVSAKDRGAVDPNWNASIETVTALAVDANGAVFVGQQTGGILKLTGTGLADPNWHSSLLGEPFALAVDAAGTLYAGGRFVESGDVLGTPTDRLARFPAAANGTADTTWRPAVSDPIALALARDGAIYAADRNGIFALSPNEGAIQAEWRELTDGGIGMFEPGSDGSIAFAGAFMTVRGQPALNLGRLTVASGLAVPGVAIEDAGAITAMARQSNGGVIAAGRFVRVGAEPRRNILRLGPDGKLDTSWNPPLDLFPLALAVDARDDVYVGGSTSTTQAPDPDRRLVKLAGSGTGAVDSAWNVSVNSDVQALALDPGGDLYAGGYFSEVNGVPRRNIAKLSTLDGSVDAGWDARVNENYVGGPVFAILPDARGAVYIGGSDIRTDDRYRAIIRVSAESGSLDQDWNPPLECWSGALALAPAGGVYAGGDFCHGRYLAKISESGIVDARWIANVDDEVAALAVGPDGTVYVGGVFAQAGGQPRAFFAGFSGISGTGLDMPAVDGSVAALLTRADATLLLGGRFNNVGSQARIGIAALPMRTQLPRPWTHSPRRLPPIIGNPPRRAQAIVSPPGRAIER